VINEMPSGAPQIERLSEQATGFVREVQSIEAAVVNTIMVRAAKLDQMLDDMLRVTNETHK